MLIRKSKPAPPRSRPARSAIVFVLPVLLVFCAQLLLPGSTQPPATLGASSSGHHIVVLLDTNSNQKKVLSVELALAEGVIHKLDQPGNTFSVITFGSNPQTLLKSRTQADDAVAAVRDIAVGQQTGESLYVQLYDALNLAFGEFSHDAGFNSLLIITEGNDGNGRMFKQALIRAQQLQVMCSVALVANHTLYGSKAIQRYGFYLRELAGKTHGRYIEVGDTPKKVPRAIDRLSERILGQYRR